MFKHIYLFIFIMGSFLFGQDDYEKWLKEQEAELIEMASKENEYLESVTAEFEGYVNQQEEYYKIFKDAVEKKWDSFRYSSNKIYVEYDENLNSRGSVDFEKGKIEIEVLVDDNPSKTNKVKDSEAISKLKEKLSQVITKDTFDKQILLKDQLKNKSGQYVNKNNISNFTQEKVKKQSLKIKKIKSKDGKKRLKYSLKVNMLPSHLDKRVERYKDEIFKQSERFGIDPAMVFAIIHTESSFNPKARSHIPAYGLMQLVPKSGGRDAYNYIYKKDKLLTGAYLYEPSNNIELGCAYIKKLKDVYFKNIINDVSSDYCTISAYNTGPGNVAKAISGAMFLKPSVSIVNKKTSQELFQILLDRLPFQETKNYLKKVNSRVKFYRDANAKPHSQENLDRQELQYLYENLSEYETNVKGTPILAKPSLVGYLQGFARDGKPQHGYGLSYYTGIWSTFEKYQLEGYQRGHGTWITPDNSGYEQPLCPEGTTARDNWPERGPSYRDVFQTIEGGPGYWGNTVFPDPQMKYRVNAVTDCYTTQTSSPGWNWGGNDNLNEQPGLAQLSNKLLYAPDGITFEREANGDFLGQCWMALPLTSTVLTSSTIGTNNWTLFLNAANFSGPTVYMTPEGWNRITNGYPPAKGRGLDVLFTNSIYRPLADEIGSIQSYVSQFDGQTFIQIPKMKYPVDQNGRTIFHQNVKFYSSKAIYDDINSHLQTGSPLTSRALDAQGAITTKLGSTHFGFKLGSKEIRGLKKIVETQTFNGNAWGFKWNDQNSSGIFPQYYLDAGDYQTVVLEKDIPKETRFIDGNKGWRPAVQTRSYEPPTAGWPEPEGGKTYTATLIDGSIITYGWYRFVDQPAIKKLKLNSDQQAILQSVVEAIHSIDWGVSNPVLSPPTYGSLVEIDNALIITPPDGMDIGYVPVALTQRKNNILINEE